MPARALIRTAFAAALIAIILSVSDGTQAQSLSPFKPAPTAPSGQAAPAPAPASADQSFYAKALVWAVDFQRVMVRDIGRHMAAIRDGTSSYALLVGIGFAFAYGVIHTLGPGHGKMIVASYFVGRDAQILRGLWMGLQIAVTHVISAIVLVLAVDITFRQMLGGEPAQSWWIRLISFGLIAIIGGTMLLNAIRASFGKANGDDHDHHHHGHSHHHDGRSLGALAVLAGLVPCTGAILVMLFALANGIVLAGVLMVIAISAGMALTMAAIGIAAILVRRVMLLVTGEGSPRGYIVATGLEYAAALLILAVGLSFLAGTIGEKFL
jgi:ABC-type nickel/cobalt efflux system permease component RcnA